MRQGACPGQGGEIQRGHYFLHSDQQGSRALSGLYLTPLCFNTNSPERKVKSLWEEGVVGRVVCVAREANPHPQWLGRAQTAGGREGGTKDDTVRGPAAGARLAAPVP